MAINVALDALEGAVNAREVKIALSQLPSPTGLSEAFFARLLATYAVNPAQTLRLARWWRQILMRGDVPALAYRAKGAADRLNGKWLPSAEAFLKAGQLAENPIDQLSYPAGAIEGFSRAGKIDIATELGERLSRGLLKLNEPELAGRIELNLGNAFLWAERNREARIWFARAIAHLGSNRPMESASAYLGSATSNLYGGDPRAAESIAKVGQELARENGFNYLAALCELTLAHVLIIRGQPEDALGLLLGIKETLQDSPTEFARLENSLGDAYFSLNLYSESVDAYRSAIDHPSNLSAVEIADARLGLGRSRLALGFPDGRLHLKRAEKMYRRLNNQVFESASVWSLSDHDMLLNPKMALILADKALALARLAHSPFYECLALLSKAEASVSLGQPVSPILKRAKRLVKMYGIGYGQWKIYWIEALASSRPLPFYRKMMRAIYTSRLSQKSVVARTSFLRDKESAIRDFIGHLLLLGGKRNIEEIVAVISETRSVTLVDEILSSEVNPLSAKARQELADLRSALNAELIFNPEGTSARLGPFHSGLPHAQRMWTEISAGTHLLDAVIHTTPKSPAIVLYEGKQTCIAFANRPNLAAKSFKTRHVDLCIKSSELSDRLTWLTYALLEPLMDPLASPNEAIKELISLGRRVLSPWCDEWPENCDISPDGRFWNVPWDACSWAMGNNKTFAMCLHPSFAGPNPITRPFNRVAVWVNRDRSLVNADLETDVVLETFPNALICRGRREIVDSFGQNWDLIHVIGHAHHNAENPMFSHLATAEGAVYATEIATSGMRVQTVCLSACDTGALSLTIPLEPNGLIRSFLACGAQSAVASLWPLDDEAAFRFYRCFYTIMRDGDIVKSVAESRQSVLSWQPHPYYWGPFALFKGYQNS